MSPIRIPDKPPVRGLNQTSDGAVVGRQLKCDNPCDSCRNRSMRVVNDDSEHVCEVRSEGKVVYAYEKRSPHHPV